MDHGCVLCSAAAIQTFQYWKIINNDFPYDRIATVHHMIIPLRHVREDGLTAAEQAEFRTIKQGELQKYDYIFEPTDHQRSIPDHYHAHLMVAREQLGE